MSEAERYGFAVRGDPGDLPLDWCAKHHCPKRVEDDCRQCGGDGQILIDDDPGMSDHYVECWVCHGYGVSEPECEFCLEEDYDEF